LTIYILLAMMNREDTPYRRPPTLQVLSHRTIPSNRWNRKGVAHLMNQNSHTTASKKQRGQSKYDVLTPSRAAVRGYIAQPEPRTSLSPAPKQEGDSVSHAAQPHVEFDWEGFGAERIRDFHIDSSVV
jgi:hypothetical protein